MYEETIRSYITTLLREMKVEDDKTSGLAASRFLWKSKTELLA
jgi:hypothetical protein